MRLLFVRTICSVGINTPSRTRTDSVTLLRAPKVSIRLDAPMLMPRLRRRSLRSRTDSCMGGSLGGQSIIAAAATNVFVDREVARVRCRAEYNARARLAMSTAGLTDTLPTHLTQLDKVLFGCTHRL